MVGGPSCSPGDLRVLHCSLNWALLEAPGLIHAMRRLIALLRMGGRHIVGVPKMILRFDLLEGLTGLRKAVIFIAMADHSQRIQSKIGKGKKCIRKTPGETKCKLPVMDSA